MKLLRSHRLRTHLLEAAVAPFGDRHRKAGDRARDRREWAEAVRHYRAYLKQHPRNAELWVQLGNCLKEDGLAEAALDAYRTSIDLRPTADSYLQLGHALKVLGRLPDAAKAYRSSAKLQPDRNPALGELMELSLGTDGSASLDDPEDVGDRTATVFLDFTDLMIYVRHNDSLSGIQRVVANLLIHARSFVGERPVRIVPVLPDYQRMMVFSADREAVWTLLDAVEAKRPKPEIELDLLAVTQSRRRVRPRVGDTFLIAGAFWIYHRYDVLNRMRLAGVNVVVYVHDLIQITDPQYVAKDATNDFRRSFVDILSVCSTILTNSEYVASEVRRFLAERMTFSIPVSAVTLATELGRPLDDGSQNIGGPVKAVTVRDYALFVSTIEIRKNHAYLIKIWERLLATMPQNEVPDLVFVGKWGWHIEELQNYLSNSDYLNGKLHILNGISDSELGFLYKHCLLTVYPSFAEGWGLPVGESLGYGKPCIASSTTSIPEVGGSFCRYFDPFDVDSGFRVISDTLKDRAGLKLWTQDVKSRFEPKTWKSFSHELFAALLKSPTPEQPFRSNMLIPAGSVAPVGGSAILQMEPGQETFVTARMSRMTGWHGNEHWLSWAQEPRATLRIFTSLHGRVPVTVYLLLSAPSQEHPARAVIKVEQGVSAEAIGLGTVPRWVSASGFSGDDGTIAVELESVEGFERGGDGVERFVGLMALAWVPQGDEEAMKRLHESVLPLPRTVN